MGFVSTLLTALFRWEGVQSSVKQRHINSNHVLVCLERLVQLLSSECSLQATKTKGLFHPQFSQRFYLQMHIKFWISQAIPELALCMPSSLTALLGLQGQCPKPRGEPGCAALQHGVPALRCQRRSAEGAAAGGDGTNRRTGWTKSREDVPEPLQNHAVSQCGMWRHQQCIWGIFDSQGRVLKEECKSITVLNCCCHWVEVTAFCALEKSSGGTTVSVP